MKWGIFAIIFLHAVWRVCRRSKSRLAHHSSLVGRYAYTAEGGRQTADRRRLTFFKVARLLLKSPKAKIRKSEVGSQQSAVKEVKWDRLRRQTADD